ncbi:MAG: glycosyl hydrolase, partial [Acidobacteriaceae bacterium]
DPMARPDLEATLMSTFRSWLSGTEEMDLMTASPQLEVALPRVQQLTELGTLGLEAVGYLSSGMPAPLGWKARQLALLDEAEAPVAMTRFTVLKPLRDLVNEVR